MSECGDATAGPAHGCRGKEQEPGETNETGTSKALGRTCSSSSCTPAAASVNSNCLQRHSNATRLNDSPRDQRQNGEASSRRQPDGTHQTSRSPRARSSPTPPVSAGGRRVVSQSERREYALAHPQTQPPEHALEFVYPSHAACNPPKPIPTCWVRMIHQWTETTQRPLTAQTSHRMALVR